MTAGSKATLGLAAAALAVGLAWTAPAHAAPQPLGLVASNEQIPMTCERGQCTAIVSAFCLTESRRPPQHNTAYRLASSDAVSIVVSGPDGEAARLAAAEFVSFRSHKGYSTVRISVPQDRLGVEGKATVAVRIAPMTTILPIAVAGDPNPLSEAEVAMATGPLRAAAAAVFEGDEEAAGAARIAGLLVNVLPKTGMADGQARHLFRTTTAGLATSAPMRRAVKRVEGLYQGCMRLTETTVGATVRGCMSVRHQDMMRALNRQYWDNVGGV